MNRRSAIAPMMGRAARTGNAIKVRYLHRSQFCLDALRAIFNFAICRHTRREPVWSELLTPFYTDRYVGSRPIADISNSTPCLP